MDMKDCYARKVKSGDRQYLLEHLNNVSQLSANFSFAKNISKLAGFLHDLGKTTIAFQQYLLNDGPKGSVTHSIQGSLFVDDVFSCNKAENLLLKEILEMIISAHHNHLADGVKTDGSSPFSDKINDKDKEDYFYDEIKENYINKTNDYILKIKMLQEEAVKEISLFLNKIRDNFKLNSRYFACGLFVKYLYSCLVDADRLDAYLFEVKEKYQPQVTNWDELISVFESEIKNFNNDSKINIIRNSISSMCLEAANKETGIYQLSVPTGGGKTLSSLRFALHHAKKYNKKHIIYVIPYLSIIEQTAKTIRDKLRIDQENPLLLEHHSNIAYLDDDEKRDLQKLAASRWDNPIIITTMVQFLDTVMSSHGSKLRKFHNMQDAVIIFDEIQFLPINTVNLFNEVISFLSNILNTTILLCSATQPLLESTDRKNLVFKNEPYLIQKVDSYFQDLKRTNIVVENDMNINDFAYFILNKAKENSNCLVIVNTKKYARDVFNKLKDMNSEFQLLHLSTSMYSAHRFEVLEQIKKYLENDTKVICISTQLIEAGVDISFNCVIRAMAGLDSILQASGRCNRNGESITPKNVYTVPLKDENLDRLQDIKLGKDITLRVIHENQNKDLLSNEVLDQYYKYYFFSQHNIMDFPVDNDSSIYEMLSTNKTGKGNHKNRTGNNLVQCIYQAFATADEKYYTIANNTQSVIVSCKDSEGLINQYKNSTNIKEKLSIIRKLEKYSVSIYKDYELKILSEKKAISVIDDEFGLHVLDKNYYNELVGLLLNADPKSLVI
jgi:CRISPR-associated endonuclease/helicase Cas3